MALIDMFHRKKTHQKPENKHIGLWSVDVKGLIIQLGALSKEQYYGLEQLKEEGYLAEDYLPWENFYELLKDSNHLSTVELFGFPTSVCEYRMSLTCKGAISDEDFTVLAEWHDGNGKTKRFKRIGAFIEKDQTILQENHWRILELLAEFRKERDKQPGVEVNRTYWGLIRSLAKQSQVSLEHYLEKTSVLTPEKLELTDVRISENGKSLTATPTFMGAPKSWERAFQNQNDIKKDYVLPDEDGKLVHITLPDRIHKGLQIAKDVLSNDYDPDACADFINDPESYLGNDSDTEEIFISPTRPLITYYSPKWIVNTGESNEIRSIKIELTPLTLENQTPEYIEITTPDEFLKFVNNLAQAYERKSVKVHYWRGFSLSLSELTQKQCDDLIRLANDWDSLSLESLREEALDLNNYGDRVIGFGQFLITHFPNIISNATNKWLTSEDVQDEIGFDESDIQKIQSYDENDVQELKQRIKLAEECGGSVKLPGISRRIQLEDAKELVELIQKKIEKQRQKYDEDEELNEGKVEVKKGEKLGLITNWDGETCNGDIQCSYTDMPDKPYIPKCLKKGIFLKQHQIIGLNWLQFLFNKTLTGKVKGCLLADDMGLGKTLQILTFIISYLEIKNSNALPALIVAPVALLNNWQEELYKFFDTNLSVLTLYDDTVRNLRLGNSRQNQAGLGEYKPQLKPGWLGDAKIVLTTYETLRTYQMSIGREDFSIMVCDEAQKIKNPNTAVHNAALAVKALFKVACTGTPVENSLIDLWSMFNFCQSGYLGTLSDFKRTYTGENVNLEPLRQQIACLTLRRMKKNIATDLPEKIINQECLSISMTPSQSELYRRLIKTYQSKKLLDKNKNFVLQVLPKLRLACSAPQLLPEGKTLPCNKLDSIKLLWLLETLRKIQKRGEKVIIFSEIKNVQRMLAEAIEDEFGFKPDIVNGATKSSMKENAHSNDSREALIRSFQAKPGFNVIVLSGLAVGFGVNIQEANHVIHFTRLWNPAKEDQATDRAYRIGQTRPVTVYYPTVVSDEKSLSVETFDQIVNDVLERKRQTANDMLDGVGNDLDSVIMTSIEKSLT